MKITIEFESLEELLDFQGISTQSAYINKKKLTIFDLLPDHIDGGPRARNCLSAAEILTVDDLLLNSENDLLKVPNLGRRSLRVIVNELAVRGMKLA